MKNIRTAAGTTAIADAVVRDEADPDVVQHDFDRDFDEMVSTWVAEQGGYDATQDCLDRLVETRTVMAALHAREQRLLAELQSLALALTEADRNQAEPNDAAKAETREMAWRSMVAEVAVATRLADRTVQTMMNTATVFVESLPTTLNALETGQISISHARVILEHAQGIEGVDRADFERLMVEKAEATTPGKLASSAKVLAARLQSTTFEERHSQACELRHVTIRDLNNGMSELLHLLPTPLAAAIFDRLTRQAKAVSAKTVSTMTDSVTDDPRTRDQLRSDIATELLLTAEPARGDGAPHLAAADIRAEISITIPALTLLGESHEPATLTGRGPIDLDIAVQLASKTPEFTRVLTDPVTDMVIGADTYRPSASLRRYLAARDQHCLFPTCNRDSRWCDIDHTVAWEDGGKTVPENLAHLCRGHHMLKHHSRWKVRQTAPGVLEWTSPHGDVLGRAEPPGPRFRDNYSPPPF